MSDYQLFIDGCSTEAIDGKSFDVTNPGNGETIGSVAQAGIADVDAAVAAARRAFDNGPWPRLSGAERAEVLLAVADLLVERQMEIAQLEARNSGGTIRKALLADVTTAAATFRTMAGYAQTLPDEEELAPITLGAQSRNYVRYEPFGVCAGITPWNFPLVMAAWKIAPAIAAGNVCVIKPATITPLSTIELAKICHEAGAPAGVVNVVPGPGRLIGERLAGHPDVDKVSFTGSTEVGRQIMVVAAATVKKVTLELGGKSPAIVTDDADLDLAARGVAFGTFFHNGQVCQSGTRAIVDAAVYDEFLDKLVDQAASIKLGDQLDFATDQGPLASKAQLETVRRYVEVGQQEGAKLLCGGRSPEGERFADGYYYEPTIFVDVDNSMTIAREEIFGPVLCVIKSSGDDDAVRIANDSIYGLAGAVWCGDADRATGLAERIESGTVWINEHHILSPEHPFGGYKQSGVGRELGVEGYNEYRQSKRIHVDGVGANPAAHMTFALLFS